MTDETTFTLANTCRCEDEAGEPVDCGGDCFSADVDVLAEEIARWVEAHPSTSGYLIEGSGMGWQKRAGVRDWDGREPLYDAIGVNGAWEQRYTFGPDQIRIIQSHHDAMGEHYLVRAKRADEE